MGLLICQLCKACSLAVLSAREFSHVATPEDNAYIEALHSNLQREVIDRFEFDSIYHAQMTINRY